MSDACGTFEAVAFRWIWDDDTLNPMPDGGPCGLNVYRPTDYDPGDVWPSPAPPGPYAGALSAFDLTDPAGNWHLFVVDDSNDKVGFFNDRFELLIETRPKAQVAFAESAVRVPEGSSRALALERSGPAALGPGAVTVTSLPVNASSGTDFTPVSTAVKFGANERRKTVEVDAVTDRDQEPDEMFVLSIGSPTGDAATSAPSSVAVTIPGPATTGSEGDGGDTTPPSFHGAVKAVPAAFAVKLKGRPELPAKTTRKKPKKGTTFR